MVTQKLRGPLLAISKADMSGKAGVGLLVDLGVEQEVYAVEIDFISLAILLRFMLLIQLNLISPLNLSLVTLIQMKAQVRFHQLIQFPADMFWFG
jgi:hypothetical protein